MKTISKLIAMKLRYLLFLLLPFFFTSCKKENQKPFIPKNHLADFITEKSQFFDLDTIEFKEIIGKYGTKIRYVRDYFNLKQNDKVQLELIELYDFNEILYRNIQTLTTDNELLETSGVLKIVFTSNGKKLNLRKGEKIIVYPPKRKLKNNTIFLSESDHTGNIKWKITSQNYRLFSIYRGGGIWVKTLIDKDSLPYYKKINLNSIGHETYEKYISKDLIVKDFFILNQNDSNWINIDRFVKNTSKINFKLNDKSNKFSGFDSYIVYKNIDSFIHESKFENDILFENIPISGTTYIIIVGSYRTQIYYDKITLNEKLDNSEIQLNMKKTTKEELKNLFKQ
ncbi:hypothetical protein [Tenacibaculum halocynthiae]|uniref:hypothetical protein n=1 Tax=Tenacibaculum halocynthiae TaxID=1254437 RepID=UPI0038B624BB